MSTTAFCRLLRSRWDKFARAFWPKTPHERAQRELDRLNEELRQRQHRLLCCRRKLEDLRDYLERCERRLESFALDVQNGSASAPTLERLERGRRAFELLRCRVQERERAYERLRLRFRHRSQQRSHLRDVLLTSALRAVKQGENESDPDYPF